REKQVETAYAIVHDPAPALRDPALSQIVARCLEKDPSARYANGAEVLGALRGTPVLWSRRLRRRVTVIATAMLISAIAILAWVRRRPLRPQETDLIAVLPFAVRGTGQSAYLGEGMVDLLSTTLATSSMRAVDPHRLLAHVSKEGWSQDPERGRQVAAGLGAQKFVLGSIVE